MSTGSERTSIRPVAFQGARRPAFVVVDCETTGLHPGYHHRIVELAMLTLDEQGAVVEEWVTLLQPDRDLGATEIHGLRAAHLRTAPRFEEVCGEILDRLAGRVLVAHNARFDAAFLEAELARVGYELAPLPNLCTIGLASELGALGYGARLADCCAQFGIAPAATHEALADAYACAALFARLWLDVDDVDALLSRLRCGEPRGLEDWPRCDARGDTCRRDASAPRRKSFLADVVASRSPVMGEATRDTDELAYGELLDRVLEDRVVDPAEAADLAATAELYGLSGEQLHAAHLGYLHSLCRAAYADSVVTERELADLQLVTELLGIDELEAVLNEARTGGLEADDIRLTAGVARSESGALAGQTVCFTGALVCTQDGEPLTRERAHKLASDAGLVVATSVTKHLDILVVADPETRSGKAKKAREYGTRIIAEAAFWQMIGVEVR
ncbi:MAG: exonuclease domain-containing protein [Gaiellales bacterium]